MTALVLETHVLVWYSSRKKRLSLPATRAIRKCLDHGSPLQVSAISLVELVYLTETARLPRSAFDRVQQLLSDPESGLNLVPVDRAVAEAIHKVPRSAVPDMPDRIIAATSLVLASPLITADLRLQSAGLKTIW